MDSSNLIASQAEQIASLTSTVERLTKALEPFAKYGEKLRDPVYSRQGFFTHCFPHEWWIEAADAFATHPRHSRRHAMATVEKERLRKRADPISSIVDVKGQLIVGYVKLNNSRKVARTFELVMDTVFADYDANGKLMGIKILGPGRTKDFAANPPREGG